METEKHPVEVRFSAEFKKNLRRLAKKYRRIRKDVGPVIQQLQKGETLGDQVQGTSFQVFKVRVKNSNLKKGKRAGYRIIYYLKQAEQIILITIYSKTEQPDLAAHQIRRLIQRDNQ